MSIFNNYYDLAKQYIVNESVISGPSIKYSKSSVFVMKIKQNYKDLFKNINNNSYCDEFFKKNIVNYLEKSNINKNDLMAFKNIKHLRNAKLSFIPNNDKFFDFLKEQNLHSFDNDNNFYFIYVDRNYKNNNKQNSGGSIGNKGGSGASNNDNKTPDYDADIPTIAD